MTVLFGATQGVAALKAEALATHNAKTKKFHLRAGREYLHWSGSKLTSDRTQAWVGTMDQARACRNTFSAAAGCKAHSTQPIPHRAESGQ